MMMKPSTSNLCDMMSFSLLGVLLFGAGHCCLHECNCRHIQTYVLESDERTEKERESSESRTEHGLVEAIISLL